MAATPRNYWMVAVRPNYFEATRDRGFTVLGVGKAQRKRAQRMEIGDRVLFYVNERQIFPATATISSTYFEDETPIWPVAEGEEPYAWRVEIKPDVVLDEDHMVDARLVAPRMEYVRKWAPEWWPLAFQGLLHLVPKNDFLLIETEMEKGKPTPETPLQPDPRHGPKAREAQVS